MSTRTKGIRQRPRPFSRREGRLTVGSTRRLAAGFPVGDGLPFAEPTPQRPGGGVDERDLDVAIPLGVALDERQSGEERSASAKCSPAAVGRCGVLCMLSVLVDRDCS